MNTNTKSEDLFELFCNHHNILWEKIATKKTKTPDYLITFNSQIHYFEIKQLDEDENFKSTQGVSSRIVGDHVRKRIEKSQKQIQVGARNNSPSILIIFNNLDPTFQEFGTGQIDFITAMYGEPTVKLEKGQIADSYFGLDAKFGPKCNTSFSAIGHLLETKTVPIIKIYANHFARNALNFEELPPCFEITYQCHTEFCNKPNVR